MKVNPVRDLDFRGRWSAKRMHCQVCWVAPLALPFAHLETHHLVTGRSDEACNLLRMCYRCHHAAYHGGHHETSLSRWEALEIKRLADPDEWDPARLAVLLWGPRASASAIVERLQRIPEWVKQERERHGGQ